MHGTIVDRSNDGLGTTQPYPDVAASDFFDSDIADDSFVFEPLSKWARRAPEKAALVGSDAVLTYDELDGRTNQLARALRACGVRNGHLVALVLPRGPEAITAIVAVLKAGAAYVPLDAEMPQERIRLCLEDAAPELIVTRGADALPWAIDDFRLADFDDLVADAAALPCDPLATEDVGLQPSDLAYVIFTSGTTGRPKGVPISHRSLTNFVRGDQQACIRVTASDRVFQGFSPASDGHHEEIWPTFLAGATLVVATTDEVHSGSELGAFMDRHGVTIISCAPTLLSMVEQDVPSIRRILFGAERCSPEIVRRWWRPGREIINTYGPTEATVGATFALCHPDEPVTIGHPLPNYQCYILDDSLRPVAPGFEGQLCIAGIGLSNGYLGNATLTAQKFVPNPFAEPGLHNNFLYLSGDRARFREDGEIEWLGRIDGQVKVRGYRIELSDIESHLLQCDGVRSAVVVVREADSPSPQLAALLVPKVNVTIDAARCLSQLRDTLPSYMIPQALETVPAIPILPSGKVDRRLAQDLHGTVLEICREVVAPRTDTERMLVEIWSQLFPGKTISATDDFFTDLGGYSLLAARCISQLRNERGMRRASVPDIYAHATLEGFARFLDTQQEHSAEQTRTVPGFEPVPARRYAIATLVQGLGILFKFGLHACFWLAPIVGAVYCAENDWTVAASIGIGLAIHAISVPVTLLLAVALKWITIGRIRPGRYPVWGGYFLRWWFAQRVMDIAPRAYITGTPLAGMYLRLLGARVGHNVSLETLDVDCPDLVEIGADSVVESFAWIRTSHVAHGYLTIRPIKIGRGCSVGVRSGVAGGTELGEGVYLADLSCVREGTVVPSGEEWAGSPARRREGATVPAYDPDLQPSATRRIGFGLLQCVLVMMLPLIDIIPFMATILLFYRLSGRLTTYLAAPAYAIFLVLAVCAQILVVKWVVVGRVKPGTYRVPSMFSMRKWFVDKLIEIQTAAIVPVYDSLYARPWCIALGMRCGPRTEIALPARLPYDLVEIGEEGFLCSDSSVGMPLRRNGTMVLELTSTDRRVFLGNDSVIRQGTRMPADSLLGALSVSPTEEEMGTDPGQVWLGSPAFEMPRREEFGGFEAERTYRPTRRLYAERLAHDTLRIILPDLAVLLLANLMVNWFVQIWHATSLPIAIMATPLLDLVAALIGCVSLRIVKRILVGTYRPMVQPLWSRFVWNTETFSAFLHDFAGPLFVSSLLGTPYMCAFMRFMGAKVGKRAFIDSGDMTEFDLISVGDDASINFNAPLQAHLFEDRVMKLGRISIGARCSIGNHSVVLYDSELKADSHVGHISLVMKGEALPSGTIWEGSPAQAGVV